MRLALGAGLIRAVMCIRWIRPGRMPAPHGSPDPAESDWYHVGAVTERFGGALRKEDAWPCSPLRSSPMLHVDLATRARNPGQATKETAAKPFNGLLKNGLRRKAPSKSYPASGAATNGHILPRQERVKLPVRHAPYCSVPCPGNLHRITGHWTDMKADVRVFRRALPALVA